MLVVRGHFSHFLRDYGGGAGGEALPVRERRRAAGARGNLALELESRSHPRLRLACANGKTYLVTLIYDNLRLFLSLFQLI